MTVSKISHLGVLLLAQRKRIQLVSTKIRVRCLPRSVGRASGAVVSCGVGRKHGLDPVLLWHRRAAVAPIPPLACELPRAVGAALKGKKNKNKSTVQISVILLFHLLYFVLLNSKNDIKVITNQVRNCSHSSNHFIHLVISSSHSSSHFIIIFIHIIISVCFH